MTHMAMEVQSPREGSREQPVSATHTCSAAHTHRLTHTHVHTQILNPVPQSSTQPQIIVVPCCWSSGVLGGLADYQGEVLGFWDWMGETLETHW